MPETNNAIEAVNTVTNQEPQQSISTIESIAMFMQEGGNFMWIILAIWLMALAISLERMRKLHQYDVNGSDLMNDVKKNILLNNLSQAIELCSNTKSLLAYTIKSALQRSHQTKEQMIDAVESCMLETTPKIDKRLGYLALLANISTLIGLLGTIQGLIESFAAVAGADPAEKSKLLAMGISKAMNTTALGLISAITIMVIHQVLSTKAEKITNEIEEYGQKTVDLLNSRAPKSNDTIKAA